MIQQLYIRLGTLSCEDVAAHAMGLTCVLFCCLSGCASMSTGIAETLQDYVEYACKHFLGCMVIGRVFDLVL